MKNLLTNPIHLERCFRIAAMLFSLPALSHAQAPLPDVVKPPPGINLGSTSFYDGFGRTKPGVTVLQYARWSHNTEIADANGKENTSFLDPHIDSVPLLTQLIVATAWHPLGGTAGLSVLVPVADINTTFAANSPKGSPDNEAGVGDIIAGPTWQSRLFLRSETPSSHHAHAGGANPYFGWRVQVLTQAPTGSFNAARSSNVGSGYWAVVPYLAATYMPWHRIELSTRTHYQYNLATTRIANPPPIPHLVYKNAQAGQLTYANFTGSYRLSRKLVRRGQRLRTLSTESRQDQQHQRRQGARDAALPRSRWRVRLQPRKHSQRQSVPQAGSAQHSVRPCAANALYSSLLARIGRGRTLAFRGVSNQRQRPCFRMEVMVFAPLLRPRQRHAARDVDAHSNTSLRAVCRKGNARARLHAHRRSTQAAARALAHIESFRLLPVIHHNRHPLRSVRPPCTLEECTAVWAEHHVSLIQHLAVQLSLRQDSQRAVHLCRDRHVDSGW